MGKNSDYLGVAHMLEEVLKKHRLSFHMPGHKGNEGLFKSRTLSFKKDITEIHGADFLHHPEGAILATEKKIAQAYESEVSKILINGSTSGILSMILGVVSRGEKLIYNRHAHQSVYHAMHLGGIRGVSLSPKCTAKPILVQSPSKEDLAQVLDENPDAKACLLTYPTYEGYCGDIESLIKICHDRKVIVLADEAHGAHLKWHREGPLSALDLGADVVVQSFHKTLPTMTQTACLHVNVHHGLSSSQYEKIMWHLKALQTSSPSYILMESIDSMIDLMLSQGQALLNELDRSIENFEEKVKSLRAIKLFRWADEKRFDGSKLLLYVPEGFEHKERPFTAHDLGRQLREQFGIHCEYATEWICLLMTSIGNKKEDFQILFEALKSIDNELASSSDFQLHSFDLMKKSFFSPEKRYEMHECDIMKQEEIDVEDSIGRVIADFITPYPPGIPLLIPGEVIKMEHLEMMKQMRKTVKVLR